MIKNMESNEDVSDGSQRLRAHTAPAPILEKQVAVDGGKALEEQDNAFVLSHQMPQAEAIEHLGLCLRQGVSL
jgi:hypothetical protein